MCVICQHYWLLWYRHFWAKSFGIVISTFPKTYWTKLKIELENNLNLQDWIWRVLTRIRVFLTPIGVSVKQKCFVCIIENHFWVNRLVLPWFISDSFCCSFVATQPTSLLEVINGLTTRHFAFTNYTKLTNFWPFWPWLRPELLFSNFID